MSGLLQDVRYALRGLRKNPAFTAVAVLTLALGIGANTAMFSVLHATLLRTLPYPSPERLVMLWTEHPGQASREARSKYRDVDEWRLQATTLADIAVFDPVSVRLTAPGELDRISVVRASPELFAMLGVQPLRGRVFTAEEARTRSRVALVSYRFAQSRFGGVEHAVGATIGLDDVPSKIVGVLPAGFGFPDADVWEPHTLFPEWEVMRGERGASSWFVLARLQPQTTLPQAQTELSAIARRLDRTRTASEDARGVSIVPLDVYLIGPSARLALWLLSGAVFCVLLIGVSNITSVSLARTASREREIALRTALGASRARVFRQLFTESVTLAILSGLVGLAVAAGGLRVIVALEPGGLESLRDASLDARTLWWSFALSLGTGVLVGLAPALTTRRIDLSPALRGGGRGSSVGGTARLARRALVVGEFALAIVLLAAAGLLTRSLLHAERIELGFDGRRVLTLQLALPEAHTSEQRTAYYRAVLDEVEALGGVEAAGVIGDIIHGVPQDQAVTVEGPAGPRLARMRLRRDEVSRDVFDTVGAPLVRGRVFAPEDSANGPRVAIVNQTMARRLWPGEDAVGKRLTLGPPGADAQSFTVVGVVGDMRRQGPEIEPVAQMFEPLAQNPSRLATLLVRTANEPLEMAATVQAAVRRVDARVPVYGVSTLGSRLDGFEAARRFQTSLLGVFALVALALAVIGIYGVVQYSTAMRTREIGVRMALGAERGDIFRMIVGEGLTLSLAGGALGLAGASYVGRVGSSLLFGVTATDPITYAGVSLLLTAATVGGCYFPARRAAKLDPLGALRYD